MLMTTDTDMLRLVRMIPKAELRRLRLQPGERLCSAFDCEDQVPVVALYREEKIHRASEAVPEDIVGVRPAFAGDVSRFYLN